MIRKLKEKVKSGFFCAFGTKLKRRKTQELPKLKRKIAKTQAKFPQNSDLRVCYQKKRAPARFWKGALLLTKPIPDIFVQNSRKKC